MGKNCRKDKKSIVLQNKENMEEKGQCCDNRFEIIAKAKEALLKETNIARDEKEMAVIDNILFRCWQMGWLNRYEENNEQLNLKPFDIQKAKAGKPVCTRDGRKARILCFDRKDNTPIVALIERVDGIEILQCYHNDGKCFHYEISNNDLMMLPEKKEGWINFYVLNPCYSSKEEAEANINRDCEREYIRTVKIEWEE